MAILVTGGGGFVGINLVSELLSKNQRVVALDRKPLHPIAERELRAQGRTLDVVVGDVTDENFLRDVFGKFQIDAVIHAAVITADEKREASQPEQIVDVNVHGALNVLGAAKSAGCERVVYVGSGQAYGQTHDEHRPLHEDSSPSRPVDIYGITKFAAERIAMRLADVWNLDVACVRLGSVCGPWEHATGVRDLLSPQLQLAQLAVRGQEAILPPQEVWRDWIYSRDAAAGLAAIVLASRLPHRLYHLSSGIDWGTTLAEWCKVLHDGYPKFSYRVAVNGETPNVSHRVAKDRSPMDVSRIAQDTGFTSRFPPRQAYADYIDWIRTHEDFLR